MAAGRPSKFKAACDLFIAGIQSGLPMGAACVSAGIGLATVKRWLTAGREGNNDQFSLFLGRYQQARAIGLKNTVNEIREKGADDWRATAWLGERLYPEELSAKQTSQTVSIVQSLGTAGVRDDAATRAKLLELHRYIRAEIIRENNGEQPSGRFET